MVIGNELPETPKEGAMSLYRRLAAAVGLGVWGMGMSFAWAAEPTTVRMGYQTLWNPIAEVYTVLRHTKILEANGLKGELVGFTYGGQMPEAIGANLLDAANGGWMPTLAFFKAGPTWKVVSTIHDHGWFIIVRDREIKDIPALKGRTLGVSFGALVQYTAIELFRKTGIDKDVRLVNIDAGSLVNAMEDKSVDGIIVWQGPISSAILSRNLGQALPLEGSRKILTAVQAVSGDLISKRPEAVVGFLKSLTMAFSYASKNRDQVIDWYLRDHPQIKLSKAQIEANWAADRHLKKATDVKDVDLRLKKEDLEFGQTIADMVYGLKVLPKFNVRDLTNLDPMERAYREIQAGRYPKLD